MALSTSTFFLAACTVGAVLFEWPRRWLLSGAPVLTYLLFSAIGESNLIEIWAVVSTLNLIYVVAATSWLLYWVFIALCYPALFIASLYRFKGLAVRVRRALRSILKHLHFTSDNIALFDIPALEIDTEVDGLFVVRGITLNLSSLTLVAHGIEVGIKISDDLEIALQTEKVTVAFLRRIEVDDVYANLKGGDYERTFGKLAANTHDSDNEALLTADTRVLQAIQGGLKSRPSRQSVPTTKVKMVDKMTNGDRPTPSTPLEGFEFTTAIASDDQSAQDRYTQILNHVDNTSTIRQADENARASLQTNSEGEALSDDDMRAAICSQLHRQPSIAHPPERSVKITTLRSMSSPRTRRIMHRLPMLLRVLLYILSYAHTISIKSVTAAASGKWILELINRQLFKDYVASSNDLRTLKARISNWLEDANFTLSLSDISARAHVPFLSSFDITTFLKSRAIFLYRTLPAETSLKQVVSLGGADASVTLPSFLLPHHEHLLPPEPAMTALTASHSHNEGVRQAKKDDSPKDDTAMNVSVHARLPVAVDQTVLDFVAALVKAGKVIEIEAESSKHDSQDEHDGDDSTTDKASETKASIDPTLTDTPTAEPEVYTRKDNNDDADSITSSASHSHGIRKRMSSLRSKITSKSITSGHNDQSDSESAYKLTPASSHHSSFHMPDISSTKIKQFALSATINDRWIARLVGRVLKKLEHAVGDVGYEGPVPIPMAPYRARAAGWEQREGPKILR